MRADPINGLKLALQVHIVMIVNVSLTAIMKNPSSMHFSVIRRLKVPSMVYMDM